jgi:hypothetical protein
MGIILKPIDIVDDISKKNSRKISKAKKARCH